MCVTSLLFSSWAVTVILSLAYFRMATRREVVKEYINLLQNVLEELKNVTA